MPLRFLMSRERDVYFYSFTKFEYILIIMTSNNHTVMQCGVYESELSCYVSVFIQSVCER